MACRLFGTKPLPEPILLFEPQGTNFNDISTKYKHFHLKDTFERCLQNGGHQVCLGRNVSNKLCGDNKRRRERTHRFLCYWRVNSFVLLFVRLLMVISTFYDTDAHSNQSAGPLALTLLMLRVRIQYMTLQRKPASWLRYHEKITAAIGINGFIWTSTFLGWLTLINQNIEYDPNVARQCRNHTVTRVVHGFPADT